MKEFFEQYYPLIIMGAILGVFALIFLIAYLLIKNKKEAIGFDRNIPDKEIVRRLLAYAKPYWKGFVFVLLLMVFSSRRFWVTTAMAGIPSVMRDIVPCFSSPAA